MFCSTKLLIYELAISAFNQPNIRIINKFYCRQLATLRGCPLDLYDGKISRLCIFIKQ
jgi:hypothetical protein